MFYLQKIQQKIFYSGSFEIPGYFDFLLKKGLSHWELSFVNFHLLGLKKILS